MNTTELVNSLNPEQSAALFIWRDEIVNSISAQHADAASAVNAEREKLAADNAALTAENAALKKTLAEGLAAILNGEHDKLAALAEEAQKSEKQKAIEAAQAEFDAAKAKLYALA